MKKFLMTLAVLAFFAGCAKTNSPEPTHAGHAKEHKCGMANDGCDMAKKHAHNHNMDAKSCKGKADMNMTKPNCGCKGGMNNHQNHDHDNMTKEVKKAPCH